MLRGCPRLEILVIVMGRAGTSGGLVANLYSCSLLWLRVSGWPQPPCPAFQHFRKMIVMIVGKRLSIYVIISGMDKGHKISKLIYKGTFGCFWPKNRYEVILRLCNKVFIIRFRSLYFLLFLLHLNKNHND